MEITNVLKRLREDNKFKEWEKKNKDSFLAHIFKMLDDANKDDWQIGFYNKDDTMTTFQLTPSEVNIVAPENIFKRPEAKIEKLDEDKIKLDISNALQTAEKIQTTEYKSETPFKIITILQKLDIGQVYNITYVTQTFKVLNLKIDCTTGEVLKKKLSSIMEFKTS
ncbi:MAG: hypothetical protein U9O94_02535 [Nanoarchaeota archaeon]|nr:hypothetical protein [Nanoarchaeota archaeon]